MRSLFLWIILFCLVFTSCKKDECPESYLLTEDAIPDYVEDVIKYRDDLKLVFLSENNDTVVFNRYYAELDNVLTELLDHKECQYDTSYTVDIYYDRVWNRMFYASDGLDTLQFEFFPQRSSLLSFSHELYEEYNAKTEEYNPAFYQIIGLKIGETRLGNGRLISTSGLDEILDKSLGEPYEVLDVKFDNVYYWTLNEPAFLYFTDEHGLVGFRDYELVNWIRIL